MSEDLFDSNAHKIAAKKYAEDRKFKIKVYRLLFTSLLVSLALLVVDLSAMFLSNGDSKNELLIKIIFTLLLFFVFLFLDKKWQLLKNTNIITVVTPDSKNIAVGSGAVKTRIGGLKLRDKVRDFFENI